MSKTTRALCQSYSKYFLRFLHDPRNNCSEEYKTKGNVSPIPEHGAVKAYRGRGSKAFRLHLDGGELSASSPEQKPRYFWILRLSGL
jgi:hypothetical protein